MTLLKQILKYIIYNQSKLIKFVQFQLNSGKIISPDQKNILNQIQNLNVYANSSGDAWYYLERNFVTLIM